MSVGETRFQVGWTRTGTATLVAVLTVAAGLAITHDEQPPRRGEAVAFAAIVCLIGAVGGWNLARWPTANPASGIAKSLGAVSLRIFLPLVALGWLQSGGTDLRAAGADWLLLVFYLALLATDIFLHIMGRLDLRGISGKNAPN